MKARDYKSSLVSIIVPVYNGALFLAEALDSILAQTYDSIEVIVVDDGSTDATAEVAKRYHDKIHYLHQKNQGPGAARNLGIKQAAGEFLAFLDADDMWAPEKLREQVDYLTSHPESHCVAVKFRHIIEPDAQDLVKYRQEWLEEERVTRLFSGLVARRSVFDRVGLLDTKLRIAEDVEWLTRLDEAGISCHAIHHTLVYKRVHKNNLSHQTKEMLADTIAALRKGIHRKQAKPNDE